MNFFRRFLKHSKKGVLFVGMSMLFLLMPATIQSQNLATQKIKLNINNAPIEDALAEIQKQSGVKLAFGEDISKYASTRVTIAASDISVKNALAQVLSKTNLQYTQNGGYVAIVEKPAATPAPQQRATGKGSLTGTVLDESGQPVTGVTVAIPGTATDADGKYTLRGIPEGTTKVQFALMGYETQVVSDVKINANRATPLDIVLKEASQQLGEVTITATYNQASANGLYVKQKNLAAMSDGVSADMIKKTSDNNVAQVLKRVSGVTIDDGKYVTVRGMSERYNNVQLNGASLPSTEPNRRNFSFDVIPTGLVDNVTIAKTFTPDMQGEFTGGLVEVNTLAVPDENFVSIGAGTGMNTISTGKDFMLNQRFKSDWLFGNINDRKWYTGRTNEALKNNFTEATKQNTYGLEKHTAAPLMNFNATAGLPIDLGGSSLGIVAALSYRHEESTEKIKEAHMITSDSIFYPGGLGSHSWKAVTTTGAVLNMGWQTQNHSITWRNLFNNRFEHKSQQRFIVLAYGGHNLAELYSTPLQSRIWQTQLDGKPPEEGYNPERNRDRPLQGLSPYAINAGLAWEGDRFGAAVNYNRAGRKLAFAGEYSKYDQYENPHNVLDLQVSARLLKNKQLELKLNISDLLNEDVIIYRNCGYDMWGTTGDENPEPDKAYKNRESFGMDYNEGDWVMSRITKGVNVTFGASYKF